MRTWDKIYDGNSMIVYVYCITIVIFKIMYVYDCACQDSLDDSAFLTT